jgi:hypothetical protein
MLQRSLLQKYIHIHFVRVSEKDEKRSHPMNTTPQRYSPPQAATNPNGKQQPHGTVTGTQYKCPTFNLRNMNMKLL